MFTTLIAFAAIALQQQPAQLTETEKAQTIEALLDALNESYVFPDLAKKADEAVRAAVKAGAYKEIGSGPAFAAKLSADVNAVLKDAHFRMRYSAEKLPVRENRAEPSQKEIESYELMVKRRNGGIAAADVLSGNIGYLNVDSFQGAEAIARPAAAAFEFLKDTDALIIDLRRNGGGSPEAVRILCSYLFGEKPVHLNSIYWRPTNETNDFYTLEKLDGPRYVGKPVFVLTSKRTGSGAEECAYNLQTRKRATLVGETTWGGANPGGNVRLNDHFAVFVPMGRAINPVTKTNWEGTGVKPDVDCPSSEALVKAQVMAIEEVMKTADEEWRSELTRVLNDLKGTREEVIGLLRSVSDLR
ncbi:MAG: S41 family peptidase [Fimbriimonadaceae bacterium]